MKAQQQLRAAAEEVIAAAGESTASCAALEPASVLQLYFIRLEGVFSEPLAQVYDQQQAQQREQASLLAVGEDRNSTKEKHASTKSSQLLLNDGTKQANTDIEAQDPQHTGSDAFASGQQVSAQQAAAAAAATVTQGGVPASISAGGMVGIELLLQTDAFDTRAWDALLREEESSALYERVLQCFPTSALYWKRYAEFLYRTHRIHEAHAVYRRSITACSHIDLWLSCLCFLYRVGSLPEFVATLRKSVDKVGFDPRSGILWLELTSLYIRVYNTMLLLKGNTQGLLCAPQQNSVKSSNSSQIQSSDNMLLTATPLLASGSEQRAFCLPLSTAAVSVSLVQRLEDVNVLRTLFHQCFSTTIEGLDAAWAAYRAFELSVSGDSSSSGGQLAAKLLAEIEPRYLEASKVYPDLIRLYRGIDFQAVAVPVQHGGGAKAQQQLRQVEAWQALLRYEKANPLKLHATALLRRLSQVYQLSLLSCAFISEIWFDFSQLLLAHNHPHRAVEVLRRSIDRFLPDDESLHLVLADLLEQRRMVKAAEGVYRAALALQAKLAQNTSESAASSLPLQTVGAAATSCPVSIAETDPTTPAGVLRNSAAESSTVLSPLLLTQYLAFIRRTHGETAWRLSFNEMVKLKGCSWRVFLSYAQAEWSLYRNETNALRALRLAWLRYKFNLEFLSAYIDFLVHIGRVHAARELLHISQCGLQRECGSSSSFLWKKWIALEMQFGTTQSLRIVIELRNRQRVHVSIEERSLLSSDDSDDALAAAGFFDANNSISSEREGIGSFWTAESAVLCNFISLKKDEAADAVSGFDAAELARARMTVRRRQLYGGDSFKDVARYYRFYELLPCISRSCFEGYSRLTSEEEEEPESTDSLDDEQARIFGFAETHKDRSSSCNVSSEGGRSFAAALEAAAGSTAQRNPRQQLRPQQRGEEGIADPVAATVVRPDVSGMVAFSPELSQYYCLRKTTWHDSGSRYAPSTITVAPAAARGMLSSECVKDLSSRIVSPPKALCDLVGLLPKSRLKTFVDADLVDYIMATLQTLDLPNISVDKYEPLPVKDLIALRHSQLQCFTAMRQQQYFLVVQQQQRATTAAKVAAATASIESRDGRHPQKNASGAAVGKHDYMLMDSVEPCLGQAAAAKTAQSAEFAPTATTAVAAHSMQQQQQLRHQQNRLLSAPFPTHSSNKTGQKQRSTRGGRERDSDSAAGFAVSRRRLMSSADLSDISSGDEAGRECGGALLLSTERAAASSTSAADAAIAGTLGGAPAIAADRISGTARLVAGAAEDENKFLLSASLHPPSQAQTVATMPQLIPFDGGSIVDWRAAAAAAQLPRNILRLRSLALSSGSAYPELTGYQALSSAAVASTGAGGGRTLVDVANIGPPASYGSDPLQHLRGPFLSTPAATRSHALTAAHPANPSLPYFLPPESFSHQGNYALNRFRPAEGSAAARAAINAHPPAGGPANSLPLLSLLSANAGIMSSQYSLRASAASGLWPPAAAMGTALAEGLHPLVSAGGMAAGLPLQPYAAQACAAVPPVYRPQLYPVHLSQLAAGALTGNMPAGCWGSRGTAALSAEAATLPRPAATAGGGTRGAAALLSGGVRHDMGAF